MARLYSETPIFKEKHLSRSRSSRPKEFLGKGVLEIYGKFTGEHSCRSSSSKFDVYFQETFFLRTPLDGCFSSL